MLTKISDFTLKHYKTAIFLYICAIPLLCFTDNYKYLLIGLFLGSPAGILIISFIKKKVDVNKDGFGHYHPGRALAVGIINIILFISIVNFIGVTIKLATDLTLT